MTDSWQQSFLAVAFKLGCEEDDLAKWMIPYEIGPCDRTCWQVYHIHDRESCHA